MSRQRQRKREPVIQNVVYCGYRHKKRCNETISEDEPHYDDWSGDCLCEKCVKPFQEEFQRQAKQFAEKNCTVGELKDYDRAKAPRHYLASCRHNCSNYEELLYISESAYYGRDILYEEIKARINQLVKDQIKNRFDLETANWILEYGHLTEAEYVQLRRCH